MITINIDKAKTIAHDARRAARAAEFAPLDIKATIPAEAKKTEAARALIRERYAVIQSDIDGSSSVDGLESILKTLN